MRKILYLALALLLALSCLGESISADNWVQPEVICEDGVALAEIAAGLSSEIIMVELGGLRDLAGSAGGRTVRHKADNARRGGDIHSHRELLQSKSGGTHIHGTVQPGRRDRPADAL